MSMPGHPRDTSWRAQRHTLTSLPSGTVSTGCVGELFLQREPEISRRHSPLSQCGAPPPLMEWPSLQMQQGLKNSPGQRHVGRTAHAIPQNP